jgi:hypothetical protein
MLAIMSIQAMARVGCRIMNIQFAGSTESFFLFTTSSNMCSIKFQRIFHRNALSALRSVGYETRTPFNVKYYN